MYPDVLALKIRHRCKLKSTRPGICSMSGDSHTYQDASNYLIWNCPLFFWQIPTYLSQMQQKRALIWGSSFAAAQRLVDELKNHTRSCVLLQYHDLHCF